MKADVTILIAEIIFADLDINLTNIFIFIQISMKQILLANITIYDESIIRN